MRSDPALFALADQASNREPRFVVRIEFEVASPYVTSHDDITGVPGDVIYGALQKPSAISQRIIPDEGRSEIGSFTFSLVDLEGAFTIAMRSQLTDQLAGLRGKVVRFYVGYRGMDFTEFQLFQTQIVIRCSYKSGVYEVRCADITRELRKEVFRPVSTTLRDSVTATQLTIPVYDTSAFEMIAHGAAYSDLPSATRGYVLIEKEIVRYSSKSADTFVVDGTAGRGALNTKAVAHAVDVATAADRRTKVEEYIYLEGQGPSLAYQVMTGQIYGTSNTLPDHWNLGIDPAFVRLNDFTAIGPDLWDTSDETKALIFRFEGLQARDGKQFLEKELYLLLGCYSPVYSDGTLGLRRMVGVISDASPVFTLTENVITNLGSLEHDYASLHNDFRINWAFEPLANDFLRTTGFYDAESIEIHGRSDLLTYQFHGLHSQRATDATIALRLDSIRDRYSQPPQTITANVLGSLNRIEVGDVGRIKVAESVLRDFAGEAGEYNRSFEVQQRTYNPINGDVELDLFGSTARPDALPVSNTATIPLPDAFYSSSGALLSSVVTIVSGTAMPGSYTLTGNASLTNSGAIFYYLGDLTIASGCNITLAENVQLRVRGFLTLNGTINGVGGGLPGVSDPGTGSWETTFPGNSGYLGNSRGYDGIKLIAAYRRLPARTIPAVMTIGKFSVAPFLTLQVVNGDLQGLPTDLRGTGGAPGGRMVDNAQNVNEVGTAGGNGGAGLCIICRGLALGAGGSITLNGADTTSASIVSVLGFPFYPGCGGPGSPGAFYLLLDGNALSIPVLTGKFFASCGSFTQLGNAFPTKDTFPSDSPYCGFADPDVTSGIDLSNAALRIQYIPETQVVNPDVNPAPPPPTNMLAGHVHGGNLITYELPDLDSFDVVEIWASIDNDRSNALKAGETRSSSFMHQLALGGLRYYWVRSKINPVEGRPPLYSEWERSGATDGESSNLDTPGELEEAPADFRATALVNGIRFEWSLPWAKLLGQLEIWEYTASTPFEAASRIWSGYALGVIIRKSDTTTRYYWLVLNRNGVISVPQPPVVGLAAAAFSSTSVLYVTTLPVSLSKSAGVPPPNPKTVATDSTTAVASGGSPPYTYAWTWLSGGTGITIDSPTSATTTFSGTHVFDGTTLSGTARITVTDSASGTATYLCVVQLNWPSSA